MDIGYTQFVLYTLDTSDISYNRVYRVMSEHLLFMEQEKNDVCYLETRKKAAFRTLFPRPCGQLVGLHPTYFLFYLSH